MLTNTRDAGWQCLGIAWLLLIRITVSSERRCREIRLCKKRFSILRAETPSDVYTDLQGQGGVCCRSGDRCPSAGGCHSLSTGGGRPLRSPGHGGRLVCSNASGSHWILPQ